MLKNMKKFIFTIILSILSLLPIMATVYHNPTGPKVSSFDYSQYTVTYTDNDGVSHTVPLTDEAFTPEHQMALLQKVYCDPTIPGIHYAYDYGDLQARKINYNKRARFSGGNWMTQMSITPNPIPNPEYDGMTLLLVNVRDDWKTSMHNKETDMVEYFRKAIYSIKLMPNFTRVNDPQNPGYLFSIDGAANRFFFISKGKPCASSTKPFFCLFEQISPVDAITTTHAGDSFIDEMRQGHTFTCYHDCSNVFSMSNTTDGHWFTISTSGESYNLDNLSIFIPDRRFEYEKESEENHWSDEYQGESNKWYNEYGNTQNPGDEHWDLTPSTLLYRVELDAQLDRTYDLEPNKFKIVLDWTSTITSNLYLPEYFYVYSVDANGNLTLLDNISQPTTATTCELIVDRLLDPYTMSFMVTASLINYNNDGSIVMDAVTGQPKVTIHADSNIKQVLIPGSDPYFTESAEARSRFLINEELNAYKNKLAFAPTTQQDYQSLKNDDAAFKIIRTDDQGNETAIAEVYYEVVNDVCSYNIVYDNTTQDLVNLYDDEVPVTSGTLIDFTESSVTIIDRFSASTEQNAHSTYYTYKMIQDDSEIHSGVHSNVCKVDVYKTTCTGKALSASLVEVEADTDHHLNPENESSISMIAIKDIFVDIQQYETYKYISVNNNFIVSKAEHLGHTTEYAITQLNKSNQLNEHAGITDISADDEITIVDHNYGQHKIPKYVNVIRMQDDDTYGSNRWSTRFPTLKVTPLNQVKTNVFWNGDGYRMGYKTDIKIVPTMNATVDEVYYYRVWRVVTGATIAEGEVLLNDETSRVESTWYTDYNEIQQILPGDDDKFITDVFLDLPMDGSKKVTYITRMYSRSSSNTEEYFITEYRNTVTFNESTITGILDISDNEIIKTVYYDAMGRISNRPHNGFNVVVKYLRSGDKITSKQIH